MVISLSKMKDVKLAPQYQQEGGNDYIVEVGAGISLLEFYSILGLHWKDLLGVDAPLGFNGGSCPSVGLSGLVQGGGLGVMSNRYGWSADRIVGAEVVVYNRTTDMFETVIANYMQHQDLLKALKGGMGGNYGAVTRWWVKVFPAPRVVHLNLHSNDQVNKTKSISYMQSYMDFSHAATLDGSIPLPNNSFWTQVNFDSFNGLCMCDGDNCTDCYQMINYIQGSILDSPNNCTGTDYLNQCEVTESSLAEMTWNFGGCQDLFPGEGATWNDTQAAIKSCFDATTGSSFEDHSSLFLDTTVSQNEQFFDIAWNLTKEDRTYQGGLEFDIIVGAFTKQPTDCGEAECTTLQHRTPGWHIQFNSYFSNASETEYYKAWIQEAREAMFPIGGSLQTAYQNYLSDLIPRNNWKTEYFPGTTNGKPTYEFLQDVKCEYNARNTFGRVATEGYEIEVPEDCLLLTNASVDNADSNSASNQLTVLSALLLTATVLALIN
ncbi:MAG: hypothetical protein SGILL_007316 [Bacillariaceae sp.]